MNKRAGPAMPDAKSSPAAESGAPSVGIIGDSYDTALAQTVIGLFKTEVIRRVPPCGLGIGQESGLASFGYFVISLTNLV